MFNTPRSQAWRQRATARGDIHGLPPSPLTFRGTEFSTPAFVYRDCHSFFLTFFLTPLPIAESKCTSGAWDSSIPSRASNARCKGTRRDAITVVGPSTQEL